MVNGARTHPDDLELLDLVEGDLPTARAAQITAHVERCTRCERAVEELQAGRAATHTAARLELSAQAARPDHRGDRPRASSTRAQSWLERLRPAAVVVAAVLVLGSFVGVDRLQRP